jgi:hypothetical protein
MDHLTWMFALLIGTTIIGSAIAYGILSNRRCNSEMKPTRQDRIDELAWQKEVLGD